MKKILLVEDEMKMRKLVKAFLKKEGFDIVEASDGEEGLFYFERDDFDLAILDVMMPKLDGWGLCRKIKEKSDTPVIMLTAKSTEDDELFGFELGADEYITKPFSLKILLARITALLRKTSAASNTLKIGDIELDEESHVITYQKDPMELTPKEFEMLAYMLKNENKAITRERFLDHIWGFDYFGDLRTVDTHIKQLRKKLDNRYIKTVRGIGYKLQGE